MNCRKLILMISVLAAFPLRAAFAQDTDSISDYFDHWYDRVSEAQASQPHWMTPLMTVTPRLEEEFRYDQYFERTNTGSDIANFDAGKGLELIPTTTNEVLLNLPPYMNRSNAKAASGWGDWPLLTIKQRLDSANEENGNYIATAFLGVQEPLGTAAFTSHALLITPTLAAGKGWGDLDLQATVGAALPTAHANAIGTAFITNATLQYHVGEYFWPEFELNDTAWSGGPRRGLNQLFMTVGVVFGRFQVSQHARFILGTGYQFALSPDPVATPLTPAYDHNWVVSARMAF